MSDLSTKVNHILSLLQPKELDTNCYTRVGGANDGGYVMVDDFTAPIAYSFGIGGDPSWDICMNKKGMEVHMYDHTVEHDFPNFNKRPIEPTGGNSLGEILKQNGHQHEADMILKVDIEGDEWKVFAAMPSDVLENFSQLVIEFHYLDEIENRYPDMVAALTLINSVMTPVHIHANNYVRQRTVGGIEYPQVVEVLYTRDHRVKPNTRHFPTLIDQPNNPNKDELDISAVFGPNK